MQRSRGTLTDPFANLNDGIFSREIDINFTWFNANYSRITQTLEPYFLSAYTSIVRTYDVDDIYRSCFLGVYIVSPICYNSVIIERTEHEMHHLADEATAWRIRNNHVARLIDKIAKEIR